jgi:hypothetical protein
MEPSAMAVRLAGVLQLFVIAIVYASTPPGTWPPGHPWSGLALGLLGALGAAWPSFQREDEPRANKERRVFAAGLALLASLAWLLDAFGVFA